MAKVKNKNKKTESSPAKEEQKKGSKNTIASVVLKCLDKNPAAQTKEIFDAIVAAGHKDTKFNKQHLAWYKFMLRKGRYQLPSGKAFPASTRSKKEVAVPASKKKVKKAAK